MGLKNLTNQTAINFDETWKILCFGEINYLFFFYHENGTKNVSFKNMQVEKNFDSFVLPCEIWTVALFKKKKRGKKKKNQKI